MMLTVDAPAPENLNGDRLRQELAAAGIEVDFDQPSYDPVGSTLTFETVEEGARATVEQVVADHTGEPLPDPDVEARQRFRDAVQNATSIADLKAALLGTDTNAEPDVRPGPQS